MIDEWQDLDHGKPDLRGLFVCLYVLLFYGCIAGVILGLLLWRIV